MPVARKDYRFAIVGCGQVVLDLHLPAWRLLPEAQLVAVCDPSETALDLVAPKNSAIRRYNKIDDLLNQESKLDFAVLATPGASHILLAEKILSAGINLLCEKPLALRRADAEHLYDAAKEADVMLTCIHNYRFKPNSEAALSQLDTGELGTVKSASVCFRSGPLQRENGSWRRSERENRTLLFDLGFHFVDLALLFLGEEGAVQFVESEEDSAGLRSVVFGSRHSDGSRGLFQLMVDSSACKTEIEILGDRSGLALQFFPPGLRRLPGRDSPYHRAIADAHQMYSYATSLLQARLRRTSHSALSHFQLFRRFLRALDGAEPNPVMGDGVIRSISLLDEVAAAAYSKQSGVATSLSVAP